MLFMIVGNKKNCKFTGLKSLFLPVFGAHDSQFADFGEGITLNQCTAYKCSQGVTIL